MDDFNAIFNGEVAPNMESFDKLTNTLLGEDSLNDSRSNTSPPIEGNFVASSYQYRDSKYDVSMDIARLSHVDDEAPLPPDDTLNLRSVQFHSDNNKVTLALNNHGEKVLIQSDIQSMDNFVAQKTIEATLFLDPYGAANYGTYEFINSGIKYFGIENIKDFGRGALSTIADFLPLLGTSKSLTEFLYGRDPFTGEEMSRIVSMIGMAVSVVPGGKTISNVLGEVASVSYKFSASALAKGYAKIMRALPGKAIGGHTLPLIKEGDVWLRGSQGNAGKVPKQIADKLRDQTFHNWDDFRQTFWKTVADDPVLSKRFTTKDLMAMKERGVAPRAPEMQWNKSLSGYTLHHVNPIHNGGKVYDVDNLWIVTPRYHKEVLDPKFHYNRK